MCDATLLLSMKKRGEADLEWLMIDSTIVRAHQHSAGSVVHFAAAIYINSHREN
jgi:hypothetical protein